MGDGRQTEHRLVLTGRRVELEKLGFSAGALSSRCRVRALHRRHKRELKHDKTREQHKTQRPLYQGTFYYTSAAHVGGFFSECQIFGEKFVEIGTHFACKNY